MFWIIGRRLSTLEQNTRIRPFADSLNGFDNSQIFISSFFQLPLFLFVITRLNLLMQGSNEHSKFQVVTYHYQRISNSLYFLQM
ncbi:hypothetical protein H5410_061294 [Solanum commersonii]|uniref:Uncharacterized protein n=1 Tax=Solanum commersonii TaxID=4109 RepID=A0A9J5W8Q1_SOLCO|nr:hypothetical protein H5410_061294 [Solanum commersonii]